ncbi:MAG: endonuclease/exonuclease/phosphatase family protein [Rhodobacteraceae bacterium]|nr:endonuclease/exonuclease/phosphatase family protein [Paracoccaceae bacterium]
MRNCLFPTLVLTLMLAGATSAETRLKIMSFNIYGGGANEGKDVAQTVAAIRASGADIIGLQETRLESDPCTADHCPATGPSVAKAIAEGLGFFYHDQTADNVALWANAVISRYPIGPASAHDLGVAIDVKGTQVWAFNIHHDDSPYQPYQLLGIPYGDAPFLKTEAEAQEAARKTRDPAMDLLFADMQESAGAAAVFVFGDFNEPSDLDWTEAAVAAGQQPLEVEWPTTHRLRQAGFVDTYRAVWPDPVAKPAFTWTARGDEKASDDHHDRIDFAFAKAAGLKVLSAAIVGEEGPRSDLVISPSPSDHRATLADLSF